MHLPGGEGEPEPRAEARDDLLARHLPAAVVGELALLQLPVGEVVLGKRSGVDRALREAREPLVAEVRLGRQRRVSASGRRARFATGSIPALSPRSVRMRASVVSYSPSPKW